MCETKSVAVEDHSEAGDLCLDLPGEDLQEDEGCGKPVLNRDGGWVPLAEVQDKNSTPKLVSALTNSVELSRPNFVQPKNKFKIALCFIVLKKLSYLEGSDLSTYFL